MTSVHHSVQLCTLFSYGIESCSRWIAALAGARLCACKLSGCQPRSTYRCRYSTPSAALPRSRSSRRGMPRPWCSELPLGPLAGVNPQSCTLCRQGLFPRQGLGLQ